MEDSAVSEKKQIVILGAGLAGLNTALHLDKAL